jgi:long-subunit fatty acid transport protein
MQLGLAYAKKLNKYISLGVKFDYLQYQQPQEYGNTHAIIAEVGILSHPYDNIFIGAHIYNPSMSKFNTSVEKYAASIFSVGIAYIPDPLVKLTAQVDKDLNYSATYKVGVELNLKESFYIRSD